MKNLLPALTLALAACSTSGYMRDAQPTPPPGPDESKIIVYRTSAFGESAHFPVFEIEDEGGRLHGFTETDCYFEVRCAPGVQLFLTWGEGNEVVEADLEPGKTYYLRAFSKFGLVRPRPGLAPVRQGSEEWKELEKLLPTLRCRELDPARAAEFVAQNQDRLKETHRSYVDGRKNPRVIRPEDGREESVLPAK
jgi:hypothetical protein